MKTAQELLRERAEHLKAISELMRQASTVGYELAFQQLQAPPLMPNSRSEGKDQRDEQQR